jgi:hypothetical protein
MHCHTSSGITMLEHDPHPFRDLSLRPRRSSTERKADRPTRARVKLEWVHLYPGVDPKEWYPVVQEGEYKDDLEGLWIRVTDWVTYVLAKHFDLDTRPGAH